VRIASLLLIAAGVAITATVIGSAPDILLGGELAGGAERAVGVLAWLSLGGLALLVGLTAHAARSLVVRHALPEWRYRGPSVLVMLVLAVIASNLAVLPVASEVAALLGDGEMTPLGTLLVLTVTQLGMIGAAALFVFAPRALAGVAWLPARGLWRSIGIGLGLALPAWIGAQLIGLVVVRLMEQFGMEPDTGATSEALARADPAVLVVALVLVAPVAEEIFFRGVVYNAWLREHGPRAALFGSAVLFSLIHGSLFLFLPILALGIALVLLYRATGSLPAAIAMHAGFNGITVLLGLLARYGILDLPVT
jgi:membrane protease YdiL (CAAX protease family)